MDPTPSEEPTPTGPSCPDLPFTPLGAPADARGAFTVDEDGTSCFTVTVENQGQYRLLTADDQVSTSLYSGETWVDCKYFTYRYSWCELAAGTYTLKLHNSSGSAREGLVSLVPLTAAPGCPAVPGTGYDSAPATGQGYSRTGVVCRSFSASPGERITVDAQLGGYEPTFWVTDDTGKRICPAYEDRSDGCGRVDPGDLGGRRLILARGTKEAPGAADDRHPGGFPSAAPGASPLPGLPI
ncbi:hypothetical protein ACFWVF_16625 [Streptomyces sp. NPDC058659]|uniref:hypothetical protein n=1 Tax=unclassified Streptomyces TaxID=2593676 RepID=UPI00364893A9